MVPSWLQDHVDLEWKKPDDGGAPIESFIIEKKVRLSLIFVLSNARIQGKNGRWEEAAVVPGGETKASVPGLNKGEEYQVYGIGSVWYQYSTIICSSVSPLRTRRERVNHRIPREQLSPNQDIVRKFRQ